MKISNHISTEKFIGVSLKLLNNHPIFLQFIHQKKRILKYTEILTLILVAIYLSAAGYLYINQRNIMYLPTADMKHPSFYGLSGTKEIKIKTDDNVKITLWYKPATYGEKTLVYFQGNNGNLSYRTDKIKSFINHGFGIMAVSYRGYGNSEGKPSEEGLYKDARSSIDYLIKHNINVSNLVFYGESLGSGIAVQMGTEYSAHAVILESPYTSVTDVAQERYPIIPVKTLIKDHFDSKSKIKNVKAPILIMHGYKDTVVPIAQGKSLFALANAPKEGKFFKEYNHTSFDYDVLASNTKEFSDRITRMMKYAALE